MYAPFNIEILRVFSFWLVYVLRNCMYPLQKRSAVMITKHRIGAFSCLELDDLQQKPMFDAFSLSSLIGM